MASAAQALRQGWLPGAAALSALGLTGVSQLWSRPASADAEPEGALNPKEFKAFKVIAVEKLTPNTYQYRFELPEGKTSGLHVASCLVTKALIPDKDGTPKAVIRPYTPTSTKDAKGYMDLVVKVYPTGAMSKHIGSLQVGDTLEMKGPINKLKYEPNMKKHVAMIAGGSGITPMIQVIEEILGNPDDKTQISLVFANQTEEDIILKPRLDRLAANYQGRFKIYYLIDPGKGKGFSGTLQPGVVKGVGYIDKRVLQSFIPGPKEDVQVLVCGPPGMMAAVSGNKAPDYTQGELSGLLKELGYTKEQVFKF